MEETQRRDAFNLWLFPFCFDSGAFFLSTKVLSVKMAIRGISHQERYLSNFSLTKGLPGILVVDLLKNKQE